LLKGVRYRDITRDRLGALPEEIVARRYRQLGAEQFKAREQRRRAVRTVEQWRAEGQALKRRLLETVGELPAPAPQIVEKGAVETKDVLVRNLLFESYPGNWVPANLYMPRSIPSPLPGILLPCGHSLSGRAGWSGRGATLARRGYVALAFDYVGNGERHIAPYFTSTQHNIIGRKMNLAGYNLLALMIQETMAAVQVLQRLDEVDGERIGITGSSGGGTLSVYGAACDPRIKALAPAASVRSYSEGVVADDSEQCLFDMVRRGLDYPDVLSFLVAPRPLLIVANTGDIWPLGSTRYAFEEARRLYRLLGHEERIRMTVTQGGHQCTSEQFLEITEWFDRWLKGDGEAARPDPGEQGDVAEPQKLWLSPGCSIYGAGYKKPHEAFCEFLDSRPGRPPDPEGFVAFVKDAVRSEFKPTWEEIDWYAIGPLEGKRIVYGSEPGVLLPAEVLVPPGEIKGAVVLLDETDRRAMQDWQVQVASEGKVAVRPDLRGWGETLLKEEWQDWENWCENTFSGRRYKAYALAHIVGRNLVLDRVRDAMAAISVAAEVAGASGVRLWGRRGGAWVALLTALCDDRVEGLIMERFLWSFRELMREDVPVCYADGTIYGLLKWGVDVPDLIREAHCEVEAREPVDSLLRPVSPKACTEPRQSSGSGVEACHK